MLVFPFKCISIILITIFDILMLHPLPPTGYATLSDKGKDKPHGLNQRIFDIFIYLLVWRFVFSPSFKRYFCDCILILFCCLPLTWNETKQQKKTPTIRENWIRDKKKLHEKKETKRTLLYFNNRRKWSIGANKSIACIRNYKYSAQEMGMQCSGWFLVTWAHHYWVLCPRQTVHDE